MIIKRKYKNKIYSIVIDNKDKSILKKVNLSLLKQKNNKIRVIVRKGRKFRMYLHRYLLNVKNLKIQVDHIDGNPLNNSRKNLRLVNNSLNSQNRSIQSNNKCKYKGVRFHKLNKKYTAQIGFNKKCIYLGSFIDIKDAAIAYNKAVIKYFGKYARINTI